ncbi:MAG TPA: alanine racemase [Streptosporangiaceae bacterium]|nr:alanine racemase [Streptosporangiaceae bacterium]
MTGGGARLDAQAIEELRQRPIRPVEKGFALLAARAEISAATLAEQRLPALGGPFTMPLLVLRDSAVRRNTEAMAAWCEAAAVLLAPHGKTTMAPQLVARQLAAGAWAVTVATAGQAQVYRSFGASRILIANELTDPAGIAWLAGELTADQDWECFAYVDAIAGVRLLDEALAAAGAARPLRVLVELGFPGGRTGCRSIADALAVAAAVGQAPTLALAGCAGYEGGIGQDTSAETLDAVAGFCRRLAELSSVIGGSLVSAGGSAYFDVVARELKTAAGQAGSAVVLRSGCYLTHDHGEYATIGPAARGTGPRLAPAIELWAPVLSCPEPGLALACAGRRDVSFDQGLPIPRHVRRPDGTIEPAAQLTVTRLDDQHAYLRVPAGMVLAPGDLVGFGISHPCTALDKWRVIPVVDDDYLVIDAVHTFF